LLCNISMGIGDKTPKAGWDLTEQPFSPNTIPSAPHTIPRESLQIRLSFIESQAKRKT
jgi:hypothetical protein